MAGSNRERVVFGPICLVKCHCFGYYGSITNYLQNWWLQTRLIIHHCSWFQGSGIPGQPSWQWWLGVSCRLVGGGLGCRGPSSLPRRVWYRGWEVFSSGALWSPHVVSGHGGFGACSQVIVALMRLQSGESPSLRHVQGAVKPLLSAGAVPGTAVLRCRHHAHGHQLMTNVRAGYEASSLFSRESPSDRGLAPLGGRGVGLCTALLPFTVLCPAVWQTPLPPTVTARPGTTGWSGLRVPAPVDGELQGPALAQQTQQVASCPPLRALGAGVEGHEGPPTARVGAPRLTCSR